MRTIKGHKIVVLMTLLLLYTSVAYSQENRTEISIDFRVNETTIDPTYEENAARLTEINNFIHNLQQDSTMQIVEVAFCGSASPEGSYQLNRRLANERLKALESLIRSEIYFPDSIVFHNDSYIPWNYLRKQLRQSDFPYRLEVLSILDADSSLVDYHRGNLQIDKRIKQLQKLDMGKAWPLLLNQYFKKMRNASAVFITYRKRVQPKPIRTLESPDTTTVVPIPVEIATDTLTVKEEVAEERWTPSLYLKTNGIGWMMLIGNGAVEADLCSHWSFTLPIYYSALDYFTRTFKFRTFAIQPEVRYWLSPENQGWFVGTHFGLAYYNYAVKGDWRIQDHDRETPAIGGGFSGGYRKALGESGRWHLEFTLGAGIYPVHYDKFHNERNGLLYETKKKTFFGVDNLAVTLAYRFNWKKKGGKQ